VSAPTGIFAEVEVTVGASKGTRINYVLNDSLNSPALVADGSGGVTARPKFDPFGELSFSHAMTTTQTGSSNDSNRGFTGHQNLIGIDNTLETPARWYVPGESRFLSPDLIDEGGALPTHLNPYAYVLNRPTSLTDPSGMIWLNVGSHLQWFDPPKAASPQPKVSSAPAAVSAQKLMEPVDVEVPESFAPVPDSTEAWSPYPGMAAAESPASLPSAANASGAMTQVNDGSFRGAGAYGSAPLGAGVSNAAYQTIALTVATASSYLSMFGMRAPSAAELAGITYGVVQGLTITGAVNLTPASDNEEFEYGRHQGLMYVGIVLSRKTQRGPDRLGSCLKSGVLVAIKYDTVVSGFVCGILYEVDLHQATGRNRKPWGLDRSKIPARQGRTSTHV
jgi:RHS repeat-associated protein